MLTFLAERANVKHLATAVHIGVVAADDLALARESRGADRVHIGGNLSRIVGENVTSHYENVKLPKRLTSGMSASASPASSVEKQTRAAHMNRAGRRGTAQKAKESRKLSVFGRAIRTDGRPGLE